MIYDLDLKELRALKKMLVEGIATRGFEDDVEEYVYAGILEFLSERIEG